MTTSELLLISRELNDLAEEMEKRCGTLSTATMLKRFLEGTATEIGLLLIKAVDAGALTDLKNSVDPSGRESPDLLWNAIVAPRLCPEIRRWRSIRKNLRGKGWVHAERRIKIRKKTDNTKLRAEYKCETEVISDVMALDHFKVRGGKEAIACRRLAELICSLKPTQQEPLSDSMSPGVPRDIIKALEEGELITRKDIGPGKRFGRPYSKIVNDIKNQRWKNDRKDEILELLRSIPKG